MRERGRKNTDIPMNFFYYFGEKTLDRDVIFMNTIYNGDLHILVLVSTVSL